MLVLTNKYVFFWDFLLFLCISGILKFFLTNNIMEVKGNDVFYF